MATWPQIAAGQRITTALLSGLTYNYAIKESSQTVTSSITPVNDTDLFFPIEAGAQYEFDAILRWSGLQVAGLRTAWTAPTGTSFNRLLGGPGSSNAIQTDANTTEMRWVIHGHSTQAGMTNPRNSTALHVWSLETAILTAGSTAGNVQLQWAQLATNATGTVMQPSSYIRYRRIG